MTIDEPDMDKIDFTSFILSLSSSALMGMGEIPNPLTGEIEKDFCAAKETIQIIELLAEKTMGNLTSEERGLLESVLIDLRIKYVACANRCRCSD
ncbi:DUF1844 domain-containing protein [Myxococcota bacterium]|nr:DUF1844 domain-containing protein [Myxococcota bacterium]